MKDETKIQSIAKHYLGRNVTASELELMPHILHLVINNANINLDFLDNNEKDIIKSWQEEELIKLEEHSDTKFSFKICTKLLNAITEMIKIEFCQDMTF